MPGGGVVASGTSDVNRIEAPVTVKAYLTCVFAAFGGILFGYDSGYIGGVLAMNYFTQQFGGPVPVSNDAPNGYAISTSDKSLITSILSAGTFFGALFAGWLADFIGRRLTIVVACVLFIVGVILQTASSTVGLLVGGRVVAGFAVGIISATVILYMSEIAPKKIRGAIVSGYQFAITIGIFLASIVDYATEGRNDSGSYRIPIAIQFAWALILGGGLLVLPESPRYFVKKGNPEAAVDSLVRIRGQPATSDYILAELAEIQANFEYESSLGGSGWADCFKGGFKPSGNLRRVLLGVFLQMFQQLTGVNFIFYYGATFFKASGIEKPFIINVATSVVNVGTTPLSWWTIEKFGRRPLLIYGALLMLVCEFIVAGVGTALPGSAVAGKCLIAFVLIYIFGFATTWGPAAWVVIGEIFPLPIRSKGVSLSTASNWFWNWVLAYTTPYMVDADKGNLQAKIFFVWGGCCTLCALFAFFMVPETKGLSLEQVDRMLEETTPANSAKWVPHDTFAAHHGAAASEKEEKEEV
ncbi:MSTA protein [Flagelloscypha sp. PMI_526]|nr:MSTA protein [Flagelloscypha sp. PMI_526]